MKRPILLRALLSAALHVITSASLAAGSAPPQAAGVPVLIYHEIVTDGRPQGETVISLERFAEQMRYLADQGYTTLSMDELVGVMKGERTTPARSVVLTFDDGWKNVLDAVPVLERHGFKASFWIITAKGIGHDNLEWTDIEALARNPLFEVQSHTASHPWHPRDNLVSWMEGKVSGKGPPDVRAELMDSKRVLEARLGRPVHYLAWPVGWYDDAMVQLARDIGYKAVLTAEDGVNRPGDDVFFIRRVFIDGACNLESFIRVLDSGAYRPCQTTGVVTRGHLPDAR